MVDRAPPFRPDAPIVAEIAAGAVVLHSEDGTAFLIHQADEDRWCFPKGHVDPGEFLETAALREIREECGFERVRLAGELLEVNYRFYQPKRARNVHKTVVYFLGYTDEREARLETLFDRAAWMPLADAELRVTYDLDREVLRAARARVGRLPSEKKEGKG
jgi:8-oxo-dGTP pyrophosphatase MutT (NUDIX family)